ncbi:MAG TPA: TetR/AcrR family transcriptional regulator [Candidatus Binataceae bacterium]|nr:TetR/AcrR family transcriptional regulator [Candidatus Binataceae bacterium]
MDMQQSEHESKTKLLDATLKMVRTKGYAATRIEDVCAEAGVTKGSFFHHFKSKEDLGLAAAAHWDAFTIDFFANAPYHQPGDPLDRLLAYVDFRKANLTGDLPDFTCFAGTIVQEAYRTHPDVSGACGRNIIDHAKTLEADIAAAMRKYGVRGKWTAESLALHIQAVIHGGFILAKATGSAAVAAHNLDHLRRYLEQTFSRPARARRHKGIRGATAIAKGARR